ncbi:MAG TPA: archease [bacterium]|jgi:SHS2 domain-containing protein|nr:archease [bacterium]HNT65738.1 archease [bacterium]HOX85427.1 archease [bacterium]HPG44586.1 archease [bacterium]HPM97144.1 archease [bacterium]
MISVERLQHTADIGLALKASTLEELFKAAAIELFRLICSNSDEILEKEEHSLSVEGHDLEEMLVNWLSELNFLFQTEQILVAEIIALNIDKLLLHAKFSADRLDSKRHQIHTEIKAVTYHDLLIRPISTGWEARIIFDV